MKKIIAIILTITILITGMVTAMVTAQPRRHYYQYSDVHTVQSGESLYLIAKRHGTTLERVRQLNPYHGDMIYPGQNIIVRRSIHDTGQNFIPYRVVYGDTVGRIAERFGTGIALISAINPDVNIDMIYAGQKLNVLADFTEHRVVRGDTLYELAQRYSTTVEMIQLFSGIDSTFLKVGEFLNIPTREMQTIIRPEIPWTVNLSGDQPTWTYTTYNVRVGDTAWSIAGRFGIPIQELLRANEKSLTAQLRAGQTLQIPVHNIPRRTVPGSQFGEYLDWQTEAQFLLPINQTATIIDFETETSFRVRRTIGTNHADVEPLTAQETEIARSIFGGRHSREPRAIIVEVDGRRIAASMSFYPHGVYYIPDNNFDGHFDIHFRNSSHHADGRVDAGHQDSVRTAAGR